LIQLPSREVMLPELCAFPQPNPGTKVAVGNAGKFDGGS
jgi:hypothetical protein